MELVSDLAKAWITFRLLQIKQAKTLRYLEMLDAAINADINSLFEDELISMDECVLVCDVIRADLNQRTNQLNSLDIP